MEKRLAALRVIDQYSYILFCIDMFLEEIPCHFGEYVCYHTYVFVTYNQNIRALEWIWKNVLFKVGSRL